MKQYKYLAQKVLDEGLVKSNRTGIGALGIFGAHLQFKMSDGFPVATIKKMFWKSAVAEMLGFLRGYESAADFRALGCNVWNANANENEQWLNNPYRQGEDDLGPIYGSQARRWHSHSFTEDKGAFPSGNIQQVSICVTDQLKMVYDDLKQGIDNRREIVTHWNPGELDEMALPPCHVLYKFGIQGDELNLAMFQRSMDVGLGCNYNIVGYSWLLMVMAQITGLKPGVFNHFIDDVHIYKNHIEGVKTMLSREPLPLPQLVINPDIKTLKDLETWVTVDDFELEGYEHHPAIKLRMAV